MTAFTTPTPLELGDRAGRACQTVSVCQANNPAMCEFFVPVEVPRCNRSPELKPRTLHVRIRPGFSSFAAVERAGDGAVRECPCSDSGRDEHRLGHLFPGGSKAGATGLEPALDTPSRSGSSCLVHLGL